MAKQTTWAPVAYGVKPMPNGERMLILHEPAPPGMAPSDVLLVPLSEANAIDLSNRLRSPHIEVAGSMPNGGGPILP